MLQNTPQIDSSRFQQDRRWLYALVVAPMLLFVAIGWFAPNFVDDGQLRQHPVGGDYLQEYVGGYLLLHEPPPAKLYQPDAYRRVQHDAALLGFSWESQHYFPMVYPPFYYAAVSPLSNLEYFAAARLWLLWMALALAASLLLLEHTTRLPTWLLLAVCITSPVLLSLTTGQKGTLLLLILTATFALWKNGKPFAAGAVFAMIAFKPHLGLPIGLFMLVRREWKFVAGTMCTLGLLIGWSLLTGVELCKDYMDVCLGFGQYVQSGGYHLEQGYSLWSFWQLALGEATMARVMTLASSLLVLCGVAWFLRRPELLDDHDQSLRGFSAMVLATILVSPHLYSYDLTMLVLPLALLASLAARPGASLQDYVAPAALAAVLLGSKLWTGIAGATAVQPGVLMLLAALGWILYWMQLARRIAAKPSIAQPATC